MYTNSMSLWIAIVCVVFVLIVVTQMESKPSKVKESFGTMEYSSCRHRGYSKEHCLTRPHPGVGLTPTQ